MLYVEWHGIGVPLIFSILPNAGNPNTAERVDLLARLKAIFPDIRIAQLTGDCTDGMKTYIRFPGQMVCGDAPVLLVISGGENRIVNYRLNGTMMIVDYVFDRAVLLSGVSRSRQKITIQRKG